MVNPCFASKLSPHILKTETLPGNSMRTLTESLLLSKLHIMQLRMTRQNFVLTETKISHMRSVNVIATGPAAKERKATLPS